MASYSSSISDASNLKSAMNTNSAYEGLCHPMKEEQGGYVPDFQFRYLSEDVPTGPRLCSKQSVNIEPSSICCASLFSLCRRSPLGGLCFTRGVAELLGVKTPSVDRVIGWSQEKLKKERTSFKPFPKLLSGVLSEREDGRQGHQRDSRTTSFWGDQQRCSLQVLKDQEGGEVLRLLLRIKILKLLRSLRSLHKLKKDEKGVESVESSARSGLKMRVEQL